jgi:hypothetical protein
MNIHEYLEYLEYFFDTLFSVSTRDSGGVVGAHMQCSSVGVNTLEQAFVYQDRF